MNILILIKNLLRWVGLGGLVGLLSGSASAIFLIGLDWATNYREAHLWIIAFLPLVGFAIGWTYLRYGEKSVEGNNLLLEELYQSQTPIPLRMTPLVLLGTIFTHLFGGSAGREGTAIQMGGSLADQLTTLFSLAEANRRLLLIAGVAGGFASVFGTPLAGAIFALEWMLHRKFEWKSLFPAFWTAFIAHWVCMYLWGVGHTAYSIPEVAPHTLANLLWIIPAGVAFGLSGRLFAQTTHFFSRQFSKWISYPPLRPVVGGLLIALVVWFSDNTTYIGLGVPRILEAFETPLPWYDWLAKTGLTGLTLGAGFKGGEVTPLFFTGATLGNALAAWIPLPLTLLAGMGFVAVFSGATNTPLACTVMGMELFGYEAGIFLGLSCLIAYFFSGKSSIYKSQNLESKFLLFPEKTYISVLKKHFKRAKWENSTWSPAKNRMKKVFPILSNPDKNLILNRRIKNLIESLIRYLSFGAFGLFVYHLGYAPSQESLEITSKISSVFLFLLGILMTLKTLMSSESIKNRGPIFELTIAFFLIVMTFVRWEIFGGDFSESALNISKRFFILNILIIVLFFMELGKLSLMVNKLKISPSLVFILSFVVLIFTGAALLSLPKSTTVPITFIDALFTSTSAVCVTGLIVVDTSSVYTVFGQTIIMTLFQIGGLGMMTFTSFFGFFFKGSLSIENSLYLKDHINENNVGKIGSTLVKIIIFTIGIELIGTILVYQLTSPELFTNNTSRFFFALFHSISAFCNAGFSTLYNGLYEPGFRDLYTMHLVIAISIILGGIGFPVFIGYYEYLKRVLIGSARQLAGIEKYTHTPRVSNINTRLVVYTTSLLLVVGFIAYWVFEQENSLKGLSTYGKIVTSFFGSVTPRTAGFNTIDMTTLAAPTVLFYLILMWIGASPGSTGGGLKTTTFAVAILNTWSVATGRQRVEVFGREISGETLRKSFAAIALSFLVIGFGVFLITIFNPELELIDVAFEVFSAFASVGLSLGITAKLGTASKIVIMLVMFLGRVGTITILVAISRKIGEQQYRYPEESVIIS